MHIMYTPPRDDHRRVVPQVHIYICIVYITRARPALDQRVPVLAVMRVDDRFGDEQDLVRPHRAHVIEQLRLAVDAEEAWDRRAVREDKLDRLHRAPAAVPIAALALAAASQA